jgi:hypothetical protein
MHWIEIVFLSAFTFLRKEVENKSRKDRLKKKKNLYISKPKITLETYFRNLGVSGLVQLNVTDHHKNMSLNKTS